LLKNDVSEMNKKSDVWNKHGAVGVIPAAEKNIWSCLLFINCSMSTNGNCIFWID